MVLMKRKQMIKPQIGGSFSFKNETFTDRTVIMKKLNKFSYMPGNGNGQDDDTKQD